METRRNILFASMESKDEKNLIKNLIFSEFYQIERRELGDQIRLREYGVIVMELAKDNFNHFWRQQMEKYGKQRISNVDENLILLMVKQMAIALLEVHERGKLFIIYLFLLI